MATSLQCATVYAVVAVLLLTIVPFCAHARLSAPTGTSPAAVALQNELAGLAPNARHTVEYGDYMFSNMTLALTDIHDVTIVVSPGTRFLFYIGFGVVLTDCSNVTVAGGLIIDSDGANYAQGRVTSLAAPSGSTYGFHADFDDDFLDPNTTATPYDQPGGLMGAKVCACARIHVRCKVYWRMVLECATCKSLTRACASHVHPNTFCACIYMYCGEESEHMRSCVCITYACTTMCPSSIRWPFGIQPRGA